MKTIFSLESFFPRKFLPVISHNKLYFFFDRITVRCRNIDAGDGNFVVSADDLLIWCLNFFSNFLLFSLLQVISNYQRGGKIKWKRGNANVHRFRQQKHIEMKTKQCERCLGNNSWRSLTSTVQFGPLFKLQIKMASIELEVRHYIHEIQQIR